MTPFPGIRILLLAVLIGGLVAGEAKHVFSPQTGTVTVGQQLATIEVPEGMIFLPPADARYMLEQVWRNPPDTTVIGLLITDPDTQTEGAENDTTVVVVSYTEDGHVDDSDARSIDYDELLEQMQEGSRAANAELVKQGYRSEELLGWAEPPHYDSEAKKLFWAKSLRFGGEPEPTLNYCIRILGRKGVLELNALGRTAELARIGPVAQEVMGKTAFTEGNRYADYQEGVDLVQAGGIAGLIAGGLAVKKLGMFAVFGAVLLKFAKFLILPLIFVGGWLLSWFKKRKTVQEEQEAARRDEIQRQRTAGRASGIQPPPQG